MNLTYLPDITCPSCGRTIKSRGYVPNSRGGAASASGYESCLRQCPPCGLGFSNAKHDQVDTLTLIYRDPFWNVPDFIADGHRDVLSGALNVVNRPSKLLKFASVKSEDHVTWTVFRSLSLSGQLDEFAKLAGVDVVGTCDPKILFWGSAHPDDLRSTERLRSALVDVLCGLGEDTVSHSEPDVIVDFGDSGIVFVEVKLGADNAQKPPEYAGWPRYTRDAKCFSVDADDVHRCGTYQLVRNWRILDELAGDRPGILVNLAPQSLINGADLPALMKFQHIIEATSARGFIAFSWERLLSAIPNQPRWFREYLSDREVVA